ncbi:MULTISPECIES: hypothetical protein [unclassified Neisseria]|uniref:hypothetical protein n=1 Tax=unclassified Neisseria TaxID=2623750 RepID=UPI000B8C82BF|nr:MULTISPECIES: hypothetical protein [unclassified Neisseria]MDU1535154.1 hypothetical protein [Neisseria sp.]
MEQSSAVPKNFAYTDHPKSIFFKKIKENRQRSFALKTVYTETVFQTLRSVLQLRAILEPGRLKVPYVTCTTQPYPRHQTAPSW